MTTLEETMKTRVQYNWPYKVQLDTNKHYNYYAIAQWCKDNHITEYKIHDSGIGKWSFKWEQDALLFSLKWQ